MLVSSGFGIFLIQSIFTRGTRKLFQFPALYTPPTVGGKLNKKTLNMNSSDTDSFDSFDSAINSSIEMSNPNMIIPIYVGSFIITENNKNILINGSIYYEWLPSPKVAFSGIISESLTESFALFNSDGLFEIIVDGLIFGNGFITYFSYKTHIEIEGQIQGKAVLGDNSIKASKVIFSIPNLKEFIGSPIKWEAGKNGGRYSNGRIVFENDDFLITIDKVKKYEELKKELRKSGGYIILYNGEIHNKKGDISSECLKNIIPCLSTYLSFLNGRRCSPLFIQGIYDKKVIWTDYSSYINDQYKDVFNLSSSMSIVGYNKAWSNFYNLWQNSSDKDFLIKSVHWYIEANLNSGFLEGSIIITQIALELIYNWLIVEKKKLIKGKDCENISASNKIRLLLSEIESNKYPTNLKSLEQFILQNQKVDDEVEAFIQIRNAIVHSQENKRKDLTEIPLMVKYEVLQLGLSFIERSLLHILGFNEKFNQRCSGSIWIGDRLDSLS